MTQLAEISGERVDLLIDPSCRTVFCPECGEPVAHITDRDGVDVFKPLALEIASDDGRVLRYGLYFRSLSDEWGYCERCGGRVYWSKRKGGEA